jgi:hypothetical protein
LLALPIHLLVRSNPVTLSSYVVKGATLRAYVKFLRDHKKLEAICARVSTEVAAVLNEPPLPGSWLEAKLLEDIVEAYTVQEGKAASLDMARQVIGDMVPKYVGVMQGVLRILGMSPPKLLARMNEMMKPTVMGQDYQVTSTGERSCLVDLRIATTRQVPRSAFIGPVAAFELIFSLCGIKGTISDAQVTGPQSARFTLSW